MRRFFVEEIKLSGRYCSITGSEAKHIARVMRMRRGDRFVLMDRKGTRFLALIESSSPHEVRVSLIKPLPMPPPSPVKISLCQSILKSQSMDCLIQKTSELGVDYIFPFSSERTVVRLKEDRFANRLKHWREIARSSAKQSDRGVPAEIGPPSSFIALMEKHAVSDSFKVILWEREDSRDLKMLLKASSVKTITGIVGPEGGFTLNEIELARDADFIPVSLGKRILRSETAAITMVAIIQYEFGDLSLSN
ncbi:MAG: 16S rRNA (uracil(1498)-N(3))-methyltransferase [Deltaproteobacteria bacterium]|nr:16S rRNA (uracil(1498)-N(3))-methyltransferase [Deltaproteobacteria bacterium]